MSNSFSLAPLFATPRGYAWTARLLALFFTGFHFAWGGDVLLLWIPVYLAAALVCDALQLVYDRLEKHP